MNIYILLDRSGSMSYNWAETVGSINAYVTTLENPDDLIYVAAFDNAYETLRECSVAEFKDIDVNETSPRGTTPLYDSCSRIMSIAESCNADKTILVVITDGVENGSREVTREQIKARVDSWEAKEWEVIFLGADFDSVDTVSASIGVVGSKSASMVSGQMLDSMVDLATRSVAYASCNTRIDYSMEDKLKMSGKA